MDENLIRVDLTQLHDSPFNPRRTFQEAGLREMAADIAQVDVHTPLTIRQRFPNPLFTDYDPQDGYEVVFGHRRLRAARIARDELGGKADVLCRLRELTDEEVKRLQISENLQREDVHPIEEAEGFAALMRDHRVTAAQLVEQTGKSRSYIYGRLQLLQACPAVRDACLAGEIGSEVALLVARLRSEKLQAKALAAIKGKYLDWGDGGGKSFRAIRSLLNEQFTLDLNTKGLLFEPADDTLVPAAGSCTTCPKRSGNAPEYADVVASEDEHSEHWDHRSWLKHSGPDVCTDPECFDAKKKAALARQAAALRAEGLVVVEGAKARQSVGADGKVKGAYIAIKDVKKALVEAKRAAQRDPSIVPPQVVTIQDPRTGKTVQAVKASELRDAGVEVAPPPAPKSSSGHLSWEAERKQRQEISRQQTERNLRALKAVRARLAGQPLGLFEVRLVAWSMLEDAWNSDDAELLPEIWGGETSEQMKQRLGTMDGPTLTRLILDMALMRDIAGDGYEPDAPVPYQLVEAAAHCGLDLQALEEPEAPTGQPTEPTAETTPTPSSAARARKKAAGGAKKAAPAVKYRDPATGSTWSGRGLQPAWLKAKLKSGKRLSDFSVDGAGEGTGEQTDDAGAAGGSDAQADLLEEAGA